MITSWKRKWYIFDEGNSGPGLNDETDTIITLNLVTQALYQVLVLGGTTSNVVQHKYRQAALAHVDNVVRKCK